MSIPKDHFEYTCPKCGREFVTGSEISLAYMVSSGECPACQRPVDLRADRRTPVAVNRCKTCIHFTPDTGNGSNVPVGDCSSQKFVKGYVDQANPFDGWGDEGRDMVRVEDDQGWGFIVGEDFGCIHHEAKP